MTIIYPVMVTENYTHLFTHFYISFYKEKIDNKAADERHLPKW